jgi:hypothetical protein
LGIDDKIGKKSLLSDAFLVKAFFADFSASDIAVIKGNSQDLDTHLGEVESQQVLFAQKFSWPLDG